MSDGDQLLGMRGEGGSMKSGNNKAYEEDGEGNDGSGINRGTEDDELDLEAIGREQLERCGFRVAIPVESQPAPRM